MGVLILGPGFVGTKEQTETAVGFLQEFVQISLSYITSECMAFTDDGLVALPEHI